MPAKFSNHFDKISYTTSLLHSTDGVVLFIGLVDSSANSVGTLMLGFGLSTPTSFILDGF